MSDDERRYFILDDAHNVIPATLHQWAKWYDKGKRRVATTDLEDGRVSTVFLGLNHRFGDEGEPLVFETMVFGGKFDQRMERYSS